MGGAVMVMVMAIAWRIQSRMERPLSVLPFLAAMLAGMAIHDFLPAANPRRSPRGA